MISLRIGSYNLKILDHTVNLTFEIDFFLNKQNFRRTFRTVFQRSHHCQQNDRFRLINDSTALAIC